MGNIYYTRTYQYRYKDVVCSILPKGFYGIEGRDRNIKIRKIKYSEGIIYEV